MSSTLTLVVWFLVPYDPRKPFSWQDYLTAATAKPVPHSVFKQVWLPLILSMSVLINTPVIPDMSTPKYSGSIQVPSDACTPSPWVRSRVWGARLGLALREGWVPDTVCPQNPRFLSFSMREIQADLWGRHQSPNVTCEKACLLGMYHV